MKSNNGNFNKEDFRIKSKKIRAELLKTGEIEVISKKITEKILKLPIFRSAKNIMLYYPLKSEVSLLELLKCKDKNFYFPKCDDLTISVCKDCGEFIKSDFNIFEPDGAEIKDLSVLDLIFIPCLCADKNCNRLGFGKGCYDRFLNNPGLRAKKIIVVPKILLFNEIPSETHDKKADYVISD